MGQNPAGVTTVLVCSHYFGEHGGGVERVAARLSRELARRGLKIVWAAADVSGDHPTETDTFVERCQSPRGTALNGQRVFLTPSANHNQY